MRRGECQMKPQDAPEPKQEQPHAEAVQHVADAHHMLKMLRDRLEKHAELDEAIEKLEVALSVLTTKSGGLLKARSTAANI
jgi:hypothetical protein